MIISGFNYKSNETTVEETIKEGLCKGKTCIKVINWYQIDLISIFIHQFEMIQVLGSMMDFVMISIIMWLAIMMVVTAVDVL